MKKNRVDTVATNRKFVISLQLSIVYVFKKKLLLRRSNATPSIKLCPCCCCCCCYFHSFIEAQNFVLLLLSAYACILHTPTLAFIHSFIHSFIHTLSIEVKLRKGRNQLSLVRRHKLSDECLYVHDCFRAELKFMFELSSPTNDFVLHLNI